MNLKLSFLSVLVVASALFLPLPAKADTADASTQLTAANTVVNDFTKNQMALYGGLLAFLGGCGVAVKMRSNM